MSYPIFSVIGPGKNGSTTLFQSIHSDKQNTLPEVPLHGSERAHFNKFHLHFMESLATVMAHFPERRHRILYPVRRNVPRQVVSMFIQYANKIDSRADRLGLPEGTWENWPAEALTPAFDHFVAVHGMPQGIGEFHRRFLGRFNIAPGPLLGVQTYTRPDADVLLVPMEGINDSVEDLGKFCAPAKFTLKQKNITADDRAAVFATLMPRVIEQHATALAALYAEFPMFYKSAQASEA